MTTPTDDYRLLHAAALMALFCVGMYAGSFGPALPFIAEDLGVSLDTAGLILTSLFLGSIVASASVAVAFHGRDARLLTLFGLCFMVPGVAMIGLAPDWPLALVGGVLLGLGDGLIVAALHILMWRTSRDVPSAMNRLNLYFAFGAVAGPLWAGAILATTEERWIVYTGIAALGAVVFALMLAARAPATVLAPAPAEQFRLPGNPTAWIMGAILFLYVGAEFGLGSWVSSYARESADAGVFAAAVITAGYWAALTCGRVFSGMYFARRTDASWLLLIAVAGAGISSLLLALTTGNIVFGALSAFGAGLFLGPVWPATLAIASEGTSANATATTVTMGNAGGLALPWLQGKILVGAGPAEGVAVTAVLCALMLVMIVVFRARRSVIG